MDQISYHKVDKEENLNFVLWQTQDVNYNVMYIHTYVCIFQIGMSFNTYSYYQRKLTEINAGGHSSTNAYKVIGNRCRVIQSHCNMLG